jgi:cytochrome c peroxidase
MSSRPILERVIGAFAAVAATTAALAQEQIFLAPQASLQRHDSGTLALLGRRLFFDVRLSRTGTTACASCHDPAYYFAEPRRVSISDTGRRGRRNAPSLVDVGFLPTLMWDGRFRKLEQQALGPFLRGEMGITVQEAVLRLRADPDYVRLFYRAFQRPPMAEGMARALAVFQRGLTSGESRVERYLRTNDKTILAPLERDGLTIFDTRAGCSNCHRLAAPPGSPRHHAPLLLSDFRFHNLGIGYESGWFTDTGRFALSHVETDLGAFRTPSLRNVARTGPYMHDGSLTTLEEVVEFYNAGGRPNPYLSPLIRPLFLTDYERAALVEFLRALTDRELGSLGTASRR